MEIFYNYPEVSNDSFYIKSLQSIFWIRYPRKSTSRKSIKTQYNQEVCGDNLNFNETYTILEPVDPEPYRLTIVE